MVDSDLTSVAAAKQWLGLQNASDDALLARLVAGASAWVQQYLNRTIALQTYTETYNGNGKTVLALQNTPIESVSSVTVDGIVIPARPGPTQAGFTFDESLLYLEGGSFTSPLALGCYRFTRGHQNIVVTYAAGYAIVPWDLEQVTIELVGLAYRERDRIGLSSKSLEGQTTAFLVRQLPIRLQTTLDQWKRVPTLQ